MYYVYDVVINKYIHKYIHIYTRKQTGDRATKMVHLVNLRHRVTAVTLGTKGQGSRSHDWNVDDRGWGSPI